jgi:hypothetical protein
MELALCQRYYEKIGNSISQEIIYAGYLLISVGAHYTVGYKVTKRTLPTLTVVGAWSLNNTATPVAGAAGLNQCDIYGAAIATGTVVYYSGTNDYVTITAEL